MDEHPGDTLGNRFLTFWGALAAIAAVALLLGVYRWLVLPGDGDPQDGGASHARTRTLLEVKRHEKAELTKAEEVEPGKTVRLPADRILPWAVATLRAQKAAPGPEKTPEAIAREQAEKAATEHDPNLSKFEGN
jgi:hypothetical protein